MRCSTIFYDCRVLTHLGIVVQDADRLAGEKVAGSAAECSGGHSAESSDVRRDGSIAAIHGADGAEGAKTKGVGGEEAERIL